MTQLTRLKYYWIFKWTLLSWLRVEYFFPHFIYGSRAATRLKLRINEKSASWIFVWILCFSFHMNLFADKRQFNLCWKPMVYKCDDVARAKWRQKLRRRRLCRSLFSFSLFAVTSMVIYSCDFPLRDSLPVSVTRSANSTKCTGSKWSKNRSIFKPNKYFKSENVVISNKNTEKTNSSTRNKLK